MIDVQQIEKNAAGHHVRSVHWPSLGVSISSIYSICHPCILSDRRSLPPKLRSAILVPGKRFSDAIRGRELQASLQSPPVVPFDNTKFSAADAMSLPSRSGSFCDIAISATESEKKASMLRQG